VVVLAAPRFPAPVLAVAFEPAQAADVGALAAVLRDLAVDDPTLRVDRDHDRLVVRGMGELHLEIVADRARARSGIAFACSRPQVDRRETVAGSGVGTAEARAAIGGRERFARCTVAILPDADPGPARVVDAVGAQVAVPAREELVLRAATGARVGPLHGCQVVLQAAASDGGDASEALLQQAAAKAFAQAIEAARLVELEPWVRIELQCPQESTNPVIADLGARTAEVSSIAAGRLGARLEARAPLARMLGYVTKLRSMTKGRGVVSLRPVGFAPATS
jgi:elongation factor G